MGYFAGIDLGGTNTKIGILNDKGDILATESIKTLSINGPQKTLLRIWEKVCELLGTLNLDKKSIEGIGIGIPGPVINQSIVTFFANFPWGKNINIKDMMENISGIETKLDNDVNIIALGEAKFGAAKNSKSNITIALGTGIGGGIYINGKLISGFNGACGELGHMKLVQNGRLCGCGQHGCFEAYASATGLIREATSRLMVNKNNLLYKNLEGNINKLEAKDIFDAAKKGDKFALDLVDYEIEYLAMGIGNILNILNPEIIVLSGGVALAGDMLIKPLKDRLKKYALPVTLNKIKIVQGELGNEAGIKGSIGLFL